MLLRTSIRFLVLTTALLTTCAGARAFDESKYPDWSGQWLKVPGRRVRPRYDPSKPDECGQQAPLKEPYRRIRRGQHGRTRPSAEQGLYLSSVKCIPLGMPLPNEHRIPVRVQVITEKTTFILYEIMTPLRGPAASTPTDAIGRRIRTRPFQATRSANGSIRPAAVPADVLEVETRDLRVPRTFDQTGIPFAEDGQAVIKERFYTDKADPKIVHDEITTTDSALTRPWTVLKSYMRLPRVTWTENNCTEGNYNIAIGNDVYLLSGDGLLMPIKKDQPPPDLRYFKPVPK